MPKRRLCGTKFEEIDMARETIKTPDAARGLKVKQKSPDGASGLAAESNEIRRSSLTPHTLTSEERHSRISQRAHRLAAERDFAPGCELDDWLAAEREVDGLP
jgi:hypothetical protein